MPEVRGMIVIVDYGMGNHGSIMNMLKKIGYRAIISSDPKTVGAAEKLILPGVGAFDNGMENLASRGLLPILHESVMEKRTPVLGICLGMQLLSRRSEEGILPGLGWIDAETIRFAFTEDTNLKVPHMGWNTVDAKDHSALFMDMEDMEKKFYFVHSYHVVCRNPEDVAATTLYGIPFTSAICHGNICATQFHPEKSHKYGMQVFRNFMEMM